MSAAPSSEAGAVAPSMAACAAPAPVRSTSLASTPVTDPLVTFDSAWAIIARSHWDTTYNGVNWGALRDSLRPKAAAAKTTGELRGVLSAMVGSLRQSHFSIIPARSVIPRQRPPPAPGRVPPRPVRPTRLA